MILVIKIPMAIKHGYGNSHSNCYDTTMPSAAMATSKESNGYVNGPRAVRPVAALEPDHHPVY